MKTRSLVYIPTTYHRFPKLYLIHHRVRYLFLKLYRLGNSIIYFQIMLKTVHCFSISFKIWPSRPLSGLSNQHSDRDIKSPYVANSFQNTEFTADGRTCIFLSTQFYLVLVLYPHTLKVRSRKHTRMKTEDVGKVYVWRRSTFCQTFSCLESICNILYINIIALLARCESDALPLW